MERKMLRFLVVLVGASFLTVLPWHKTHAMTGSGTPGNPYKIEDCTDLQNMKNNLTANYELANDIDCSVTSGWNAGSGFSPVGKPGTPFDGNLDGKGFVISNLFMNRPAEDYIGLFGYVEAYGELKNVTLRDVNITGRNRVGALVGENYSIIYNVQTSGVVKGYDRVGGIVGHLDLYINKIQYSSSTATIDGNVTVGGLIGLFVGGIADSTYATGTVSGVQGVGGLVGSSTYGAITNSYSNGVVNGTSEVGGLVGDSWGESITNSYSVGTVTASTYVGGLIGRMDDPNFIVSSSYWDQTTSTQATSPKGTGKTTVQMKAQATFAGWDFANIWALNPLINNGYPFLKQPPKYTPLSAMVSSGGFSISTLPTVSTSFSTVTLNSGTQTSVASLSKLTVDDFSGSAAGWNVSASASTFTSGGNNLPTGSLLLTKPSGLVSAGGGTTPSIPMATTASIDGSSLTIVSAGTNEGSGSWDINFPATSLSLTIPPIVRSGSYASTITWTLSIGP